MGDGADCSQSIAWLIRQTHFLLTLLLSLLDFFARMFMHLWGGLSHTEQSGEDTLAALLRFLFIVL